MVVTAAMSVTGPVRRALHVDPAIPLREQLKFAQGFSS
jgi:hypothetical protein